MKGYCSDMKKLKCPDCNEPYPRWKLIYPRWYEVCPKCKSKLAISTKTGILVGVIGCIGLIATIIIDIEKFFSMPFIVYFIVPFFICLRALMIVFAEFEKLPDKPGLLAIPKSSKYALVFIVIVAVISIAIIYIYYSSIRSTIPKMPAYLKKATIIVNSVLFSKSLFWKASGIGSITDISYSNHMVRIAGTKGFVSLDKNLNVLSYLKFNKCSSHTDIVHKNENHIYGFINRGDFICDAAFFDSTGKVVWTYRGNTSLSDMTVGDIDNDREFEFVVAFSGGIHLLDNNGKKKWEMPDKNVWHVELANTNNDRFMEILHSNANGEIVIRDRHGKVINKTKPSPYVSFFSLAKWPNNKDREYILLSRNNRIWLLDFNGSIIARLDAPKAGTLGHARGIPVKFKSDQPDYFAVIVEFSLWDRSILYIYNLNKQIVYQEIIPKACASITAKSYDNSDLQTLLIGCKGKIWQYEKEM